MKKIKPEGSKPLYVSGVHEVDKGSGGSDCDSQDLQPNNARSRRRGLYAFFKLFLSFGNFPFPSLFLP